MAHNRVYGYEPGMPSRAKQEFKGESDVNNIVAMYKKGSPLPLQIRQGQFADVTQLGDYKTAVDALLEAEQVWATLPQTVKTAAGGTVASFLDFVNDPANADQLIELGLVAGPDVPAEAVVTAGAPDSADGT